MANTLQLRKLMGNTRGTGALAKKMLEATKKVQKVGPKPYSKGS